VEQLLEVSPRQALRILNALGAAMAGKTLFIGREELILRLRRVWAGEDARYERRRLERLDRTLAARRSEAEISDLMAAWERDPSVEVALRSVQHLKLELSEEDWNRFRGFLLHEVVSEVSYSVSNPEG
jgi:hypothetical protein